LLLILKISTLVCPGTCLPIIQSLSELCDYSSFSLTAIILYKIPAYIHGICRKSTSNENTEIQEWTKLNREIETDL